MAKKNKKEVELQENVAGYLNLNFKMQVGLSDHLGSVFAEIIEERFEELEGHIFTGQKRVVVETGDSVLKLVHSSEGLEDNINEILTSHYLLDLAEGDKISKKDLELFAIAELYNDDPYIIEVPKMTRIVEYSKFNEWYKENKKSKKFEDMTRNAMAGYYIMQDEDFNKDHSRIISIISKYFVGSDIYGFRVPENFAINEESGRLCLIDMGSILPKYNKIRRLECNECGGEKTLMLPVVKPNDHDGIENLMHMKSGIYVCKVDSCVEHNTKVGSLKKSNNLIDSVVFSDYFKKAKRNEDFLSDRANIAKLFLPTKDIEDFSEFLEELKEDTGEKFSKEEAKTIYLNSLPYILSDMLYDYEDEIDEKIEEYLEEYEEEDELPNLEDFKEELESEIDDEDITDSDLFDIISLIYFLRMHIEASEEEINMFEILSSEDKSELIDALENIETIDEDDHDEIWKVVKGII